MKVLITGNMGYIGPAVISHLRSCYHDITLIGLDMGYFATCLTNTQIMPECRVNLQYFTDVRHVSKNFLKDIDVIVHLAAISNDPMGKTFEKVTLDVNYIASVGLAKKAKEAGVNTYVYASSCSIYGAGGDKPRTEKCTLNPLTTYAKSKVLTENALKKLAGKEFKITSLRFSTACGMSERLRLDLVLNDFVAGAVASKQITVLSNGTPWRPLINIKDIARAIEWAINRDEDNGGEFVAVNVGSDEWNYQIKGLCEAISEVIPDVKISINKAAEPDRRSYRVSFELFRKLAPNHQPRYDLITTVKELKAGLENMDFQDMNFRNSKYVRLKVLTELREKGLLNENLEWTGRLAEMNSTIGS
jgi:nucleoside-diphosphate-sugar epimerase